MELEEAQARIAEIAAKKEIQEAEEAERAAAAEEEEARIALERMNAEVRAATRYISLVSTS
eukprot:COSAG04_NODE_6919_length_1229_cov_1.200885_1_plen_61_part_00